MKRNFIFLLFYTNLFLLTSCATTISLKEPIVMKSENLNEYQYVIINPTETLSSSAGTTINGIYSEQGKTVNPRDVIAGYLIKKGFIILTEVQDEIKDKTMIVNYGESGRRIILWGYTTEITLQFIKAADNKIICTSSAEGFGSTEADDIKIAISRALDALF